ncbi:MAG: hypothetical protein DMG51_12125 [Acidobacteria bacterium]|nr:MAG: hypothetical protein DMG51_12125 [Acidobacteriota bacterium]
MASAKGSQMNAERGTETILITGATDGLGRAAALLLAERGYRVFAAGRSAEKRVQLDSLAKEKRLPLETLEMDVADDRSVEQAVAVVHQKTGQIDVLINNAGLAYFATVEDMNMEDWRRQFETNFFGVVRVTRAALGKMRERRSGRIIMISSVSGLVTPPAQGAYSASKHALEGLSNALRHELYPFRVKTGIHRHKHPADRPRTGTAVPGENSEWGLCQSVPRMLVRREQQQGKVEDHAGRLRAGHSEGHRSAQAQGPLCGYAALHRHPVGETCAAGQRHGRIDPQKIWRHARRISWILAVRIRRPEKPGG